MSETLNFTKLADAPILEEVPDGAKVYAEVDGKVYRVAGDNLGGGGIPTAILTVVMDNPNPKSAAGDNSKATQNVYTATCDNMTYEAVKAIFLSGGAVNARARLVATQSGFGSVISDDASVSGGYFKAESSSGAPFEDIVGFNFISPTLNNPTFYWFPDGTITTVPNSVIGG